MSEYNHLVDAYIEKSAEFAQPILEHIREVIHNACPEVEEKIKWSMPFFDYRGEMMCHMASFKKHAVMGFWKAALMQDPVLAQTAGAETSMGHVGKLTTLKDLPADKKLAGWIKDAMRLNDAGIRMPAKRKADQSNLVIPPYFTTSLKAEKNAAELFKKLAPSRKKEFIDWIVSAKSEATRTKRVTVSLELIVQENLLIGSIKN